MFYCLNKGWEEKIILCKNDKKITFAKNSLGRSEFEEKTAGVLFNLSENAIGCMISNLMYYHHFKRSRANHIHIECEGKNQKNYDLTLFFEDEQEPVIGGENEIGAA